jgi:RNA polymerase sporulation-specific sigma factor
MLKEFLARLFKRKGEIYYINGSDTLPPPLDMASEEKMIMEIESEEAKRALIEHNLRLVV